MLPWTDRSGHFAPLKCVAFAFVLLPALWLAVEAAQGWLGQGWLGQGWLGQGWLGQGWLGPRPFTEAIHQSGLWAIRFLALTLAVTPLRSALRYSKLISIRRILGVSVFAYAALHVALYVADQKFALGHVASEIVSRIYLTIGFIAFCGFSLLAMTSTDGMIARLGAPRWARLQQFIYAGAVISMIHFFMQSKLDITEPVIMAGIFALLLAFRVLQRQHKDLAAWHIALLGLVVAGLTALSEAAWFAYAMRAPLLLVLAANFDFSFGVRPCWFVLAAGMVLWLARLARPLFGEAPKIPRSRRKARVLPLSV
jgi:sulfoxide reductase heme-binding subunit YedZ